MKAFGASKIQSIAAFVLAKTLFRANSCCWSFAAAKLRLRRVTGLKADEIDANGSSIPFLLNSLDHAVAWLFGSTFRFEITVHPAFYSSGIELHSSFTSFKRDKIKDFCCFRPVQCAFSAC
jgi:hypothetical protein